MPSKHVASTKAAGRQKATVPPVDDGVPNYWFPKLLVTALAFVTRFAYLSHPAEVVFDEVHFGKFASHYLQREYYFDLHPPFAKMLYAFVGWLVGYDGRFKFDNIGESYNAAQVPYTSYRSLPAFFGASTVPVVFSTLQQAGFSPAACTLGSSLVLFDTAQVAQTRLILLDASLTFFAALSVYCYVRFSKQKKSPFSFAWWSWMLATGFSLSCTISTKYVGVFTFLTVGGAVLVDLWDILDYKTGNTLRIVFKHFVARVWCLIIVPFVFYLLWFWVHFQILCNSGPGDSSMSPEFQATLKQSPVARSAMDIHFYDTVSIQSVPLNIYLHSHPDRYPLQYPDGRISTQGQQVTGYGHPDANNYWQIVPPVDMAIDDPNRYGTVVGSQQIRLLHVATNSYLLTHDVASPSYPTNEEFTVVPKEEAEENEVQYRKTLFNLELLKQSPVRTMMSHFRLKHVDTPVSMWLSEHTLPEWGFGQYEINGNKNSGASGTVWYFSDIVSLADEKERESRRTLGEAETAPRRPFLDDWWELQLNMFRSNNLLTNTHPYMSSPWTWPLLLRGISFWTGKDQHSQIYLIGNYLGYALELVAILFVPVVILVDQLAQRRNVILFSKYTERKFYRTVLWFWYGWLCHYIPFFLMGRQLFLHHYLPAHIIAAMATAGAFDFVCMQQNKPNTKVSTRATMAIVISLIVGLAFMFLYFGPLAYGFPLAPDRVRAREWMHIDLHFNKEAPPQ